MKEESGELRELLRILERRLGMIDDSTKSCCGVTLGQCHALVEIGRASSLSLNELAEILDLDKSTTSRTVEHLVRRSLARRQLDPANRRCVVIELTDGGQELFQSIESSMNAWFSQVLAQIPSGKLAQVMESLQILNASIAAIPADTCSEAAADKEESCHV